MSNIAVPTEPSLEPGNPLSIGAFPGPEGVSFSVFSRNARAMTLCLYDTIHESAPSRQFRLDPLTNKTGDMWHCHVRGLKPGALYLWRADGPYEPSAGQRFNVNRGLIDPYARALTNGTWNLSGALGYDPASPEADLSFSAHRDDALLPKCVVVDDDFDWQNDAPLNYPLKDCIIYETHVRGLTRGLLRPAGQKNPSPRPLSAGGGPEARAVLPPGVDAVEHPGTYRGVAEMIGYFKKLGITSLEFLPLHEFDSVERFRRNPKTGALLRNYWGYSPLAFFAPKAGYAYRDGEAHDQGDPSFPVREFKYMVRELHKAGIEVILDVVFNHTAEGNELGPTLSFRGLDNSIYYMLDADKRRYKNYSGCGNTLNCNHPVMRSLIQDCLRYWVVQMHVDGFRFDLGSILGRDSSGKLLENPPVIESIAEEPLLRNTKIIAEAWDAGGAYQVGSFPGGRWAEWNDKYRDDVRRFWRGEKAGALHLATRITGSSDLFLRDGRKPFHSINFVTAHDGFTLNDLVSYLRKHNEENGEDNRDGAEENWSQNFGVEGPTEDPHIGAKRSKQLRNFMATLLLSIGTPMVLGGDEIGRSQGGNNNAYCQDNEISWYDWNDAPRSRELLDFFSRLVAFRKAHPAFRRPEFFTGQDRDSNKLPDITWYDERGLPPDWSSLNHTLAAMIDGSAQETGEQNDDDFYLMFNASAHGILFSIPKHPRGLSWHGVLDTGAQGAKSILSVDEARRNPPEGRTYALAPRSMVLLAAPRSS
ncbi:MAG: alpha-amylase family glycosyl hydrolase [bacterium]